MEISWKKSLAFAFGLLLLANVAYLDIKLFFSPKNVTTSEAVPLDNAKSTPPSPKPSDTLESASCPACSATNQATGSTTVNEGKSEKAGTGGLPQIPQQQPIAVAPQVREYYIPLGTGTTTSQKWIDIAGTDTTINPSDYGRIKQAFFEANIYIPTGNGSVSARLFNVTAKHPAWFAEFTTNSSTSILLTSQPIVLDPGANLYRVQLQTTLAAQARMDSARVRIVVQ